MKCEFARDFRSLSASDMIGRTTFPIPRTLLRASHSLLLRGKLERSYFAAGRESSTRRPARRRSLICFASTVKPCARSYSRIRVIQIHSRPVVRLRHFQTALSALHQIFVCLTTCSTALVWKRSYKNRRHSRPLTLVTADSICFARATSTPRFLHSTSSAPILRSLLSGRSNRTET